MITESWNLFPRLVEQKINSLLDEAEPSAAKAFQLYKTCQSEQLWSDPSENSYQKFAQHLADYFSVPKFQRRKSHLDSFLDRPINSVDYENFHLNFRTAHVSSRAVQNLVSWAHNIIRVSKKTNSVVISTDVLNRAVNYITQPPLFEKAENIEFDDFCAAWSKTVFKLFGNKHDTEFKALLNELQWMNAQLHITEKQIREQNVHPTIYLTQTEIDWTLAVRQAVTEDQPIPKFPLSKGPQKQRLIDLERTVTLLKTIQTTRFAELVKHEESIRATILDRCEGLLRDKAS